MTVAVVVDGSYTGGEDGGEKTYTPRSEEDLQKYEDLVKQSINFNPDRGDDIRVQNIPFDTSYKDEMKREMEDSEQKMAQKERKEFIITVAGKAIKVLIIVLIIFFALRTLRNIKPRVIMEQTMNMSGSTGGSTAPPGAGMNAGGAGSPDKAKEIADMLKKKWLS
jgi:flagellar M-ring protein FliF